jgi:hypothetical protein
MSRHISFHEVKGALALEGCPICRLTAEVVERYLDFMLWERVTDPDLRREVRQARGFCHEHAWALVRAGASLGIAILLQDVLQELCTALQDSTAQQTGHARRSRRGIRGLGGSRPAEDVVNALSSQLEPQGEQRCPACVQRQTMEDIYLDVLLDNLVGKDNLAAIYQASDGLCLPHFRRAVRRAHSQEILEALLQAQLAIWQRLVQQLGEVIRKNDYRFQDEPWGEEAGAWLTAIATLVGPQPRRGTK